MIKECDLEDMLDIDEILIADKKYTNLEKIWNEKYVNLDSLDKFRKERVVVENTICDIKNYASVSNTWRHSKEKHKKVFNIICHLVNIKNK